MENVYIFAEYETFFGGKPPEIDEIFGKDVSLDALITLSILSWKNVTPEINAWVESNLPLTPKGMSKVRECIFLTRSSSMWLWFCLLNRPIQSQLNVQKQVYSHYEKIIRCLVILNNKERNKENNVGYIMSNGYGFSRDNYYWQINRTVRSIVNDKRMKFYINEFQQHHGVKLIDYLELHSYITRHYTNTIRSYNPFSISSPKWVIDLDQLAKHTRISSEMLERIMSICSFTASDLPKNSTEFPNEDEWFSFLRCRPYYKISHKKYIPVNGKLAENLLYNELFHKIKSASSKPLQFMSDYGHCFETYISDLVKMACRKSRFFNYKFIPEFEYGSPIKKSSDAYIYFKDEKNNIDVVIVIEIKSTRIREQARVENPTVKNIQRSIDKTIRNPLSQAASVTCDIINSEVSKVLTKDKVYYFMSVSMDGYTGIFDPSEDFDLTLDPKHRTEIKIGGYYPVTVEGFECFIRALMSNYCVPANILLHRFDGVSEKMSFKTYMARIINNKEFVSSDFDTYIEKSIKSTVNNFLKKNVSM